MSQDEAMAHFEGEPDDEAEEDPQEETGSIPQGISSASRMAQLMMGASSDEEDEEMQDGEQGPNLEGVVKEEEGDEEEMEGDSASRALVVASSLATSQDSSASLPAEVKENWTVQDNFCTLQVAGKSMKLPKSIHSRLYGYQRQGVAWMWNLYQKGFGGILGDEMGLGKTVQSAAFLACLRCADEASHFLVVVPVTLMEQWKRELSTWTRDSGLAVHLYHGSNAMRQKALAGLRRKGGVLVTSYDMVRNAANILRTAGLACTAAAASRKRKRQDTRATRDDDSPSEGEAESGPPLVLPGRGEVEDPHRPWDVVIADEAQTIKNPSCVSGKALRKLEATSRVLLTGTPVQNKLSDLWALMDFAQPSLLGNHATFERNFSDQIAKGSKRNASHFAVELKDHLAKELKRLTAPHFLRRLKSEVTLSTAASQAAQASASSSVVKQEDPGQEVAGQDAPNELPEKVDVVLWLNLTQAQVELYNMYLESDIVRRAAGSQKCGIEALRAINLLKKLSNHPLLCLPEEEFTRWKAEVVQPGPAAAAARAEAAPPPAPAPGNAPSASSSSPAPVQAAGQDSLDCDATAARLRALVPNSVHGAALLSCKLRVLSVLLPQLHKRGHRCLIFSQSTRMLDLVQACVLRVLGLKFLRVDGSIDPADRDLKVTKFQQPGSKYFCICMSVQTGGTGLTVTAADRVILVDPAWNPSVDTQAIDRVHRLGQTKDVVVYRLIGGGAIEDKMFRLQVFKRSLSKTYLEQESQVRFFSHKELKQLFEPPDKSSSTQVIMSEQIGREALEHEDLLRVVAQDIGSTDDPQAMDFWQSQDILGFSDYQRLFMFLEQCNPTAQAKAESRAKALVARLQDEEYMADQVVSGTWKPSARDQGSPKVKLEKMSQSPKVKSEPPNSQESPSGKAEPGVLQDA